MTQNLYFSLLSPQESCVYSASSVVKNPWSSYQIVLDFYGPLTPDKISAIEINLQTYLQILT